MRFEKWLEETTTTAGVAQNLAKGSVDVVGAKRKCPEGMTWDSKQLECVPDIKVKEGKKECPEGHEWDEKMQECLPSSTGIKEALREATKYQVTDKEIAFLKKAAPVMNKKVPGGITWQKLAARPGGPTTLVLLAGMKNGKKPEEVDKWFKEVAKKVHGIKEQQAKECPDGHEWDEDQQECLPVISKLKEALMEGFSVGDWVHQPQSGDENTYALVTGKTKGGKTEAILIRDWRPIAAKTTLDQWHPQPKKVQEKDVPKNLVAKVMKKKQDLGIK